MSGRTAEAEEYYALANATNVAESSAEHTAILFALQAFLAVTSDNPARAIELSQQALDRLGNSTSFFRVWALFYQGLGLLRTNAPKPAAEMLRQALDLGWAFGHRMTALDALGTSGTVDERAGPAAGGAVAVPRVAGALFAFRRSAGADQRPDPGAHWACWPMNATSSARRSNCSRQVSRCAGSSATFTTRSPVSVLLRRCIMRAGRASKPGTHWRLAQDLADRSRNPRRQRMVRIATADLQLREGNVDAAKRTFEETRFRCRVLCRGAAPAWRACCSRATNATAAMRMLGTMEASCRSQGQAGTLITVHRAAGAGASRQRRPSRNARAARAGSVPGSVRRVCSPVPR